MQQRPDIQTCAASNRPAAYHGIQTCGYRPPSGGSAPRLVCACFPAAAAFVAVSPDLVGIVSATTQNRGS